MKNLKWSSLNYLSYNNAHTTALSFCNHPYEHLDSEKPSYHQAHSWDRLRQLLHGVSSSSCSEQQPKLQATAWKDAGIRLL